MISREELVEMSIEEIINLAATYVKEYLDENGVDKSHSMYCYLTVADSVKVLKEHGKIPK